MNSWRTMLVCSIAALLLACSLSPDQFSQQEEIRGMVEIAVTPVATTVQGPVTVTVAPDGSGDYTRLDLAVEEVPAGSTVILEAGTFLLTEPLSVTKAITLVGAGMDRTDVVSGAEDYVVRFGGDGPFKAQGITFRHQGNTAAHVVVVDGGLIEFSLCRFADGVLGEEEKLGGHGLLMRESTTGRVRECMMEGNMRHGIQVSDGAQLTLERNVCRDNTQAGIRFSDTSGGTASQNECMGNVLSGIIVNDQAHATLEENACTGNGDAGIAYFEDAGGTAQGNECSDNGLHGISISGQAQPTLEGNVCRDNEQVGIRYDDTSGGTARQNACTANKLTGIAVVGQAQPKLEGNTCTWNRWGISIDETADAELLDNDCHDNTEANVDDRRQDGQSTALSKPTVKSESAITSEPSFGPISFSLEVIEETDEPINPATIFPVGPAEVYGSFDYQGITADIEWTRTWYVDGVEVWSLTEEWGEDSDWQGEPSGRQATYLFLDSGGSLDPGEYDLHLYIEGQLVQSATFTIESVASTPSFGPITFSLDVEEGTNLPIDPMTNFPSGILEVYASFDFEGMTPGIQWTRKWLKDGEERVSKTNNWDGKEQGRYHLRYFRPSGNPVYSGSWEFQLYIQGQLVQSGTFSVQ